MSADLPSSGPKPAVDVTLYRTFVTDDKDRPKVGSENFMLGARVPIDIKAPVSGGKTAS